MPFHVLFPVFEHVERHLGCSLTDMPLCCPCELLAEVGSDGSTVFVPYSPGTMSTVADEFRQSLMEADAAALDGRK